VNIPLVNHRAVFSVQLNPSSGSYFRLCPVSLLLQDGVMQRGPGRHVSVSQVISDDVPAEGPVVVESSIEHDVAGPSEAVGQLV